MNITNCLLVVILFILVKQFYPTIAETLVPAAIVALALYGCYWVVAKLPAQWKRRKVVRQQEEKDEKKYWEYQQKHDAIRANYDPRHEWNEATSVPGEYLQDIRRLNLEYRDVLQRRNGWTADDFGK